MDPSESTPKEDFEPWRKLEQFFSGGPVYLSPNGSLACSCGEEIKVPPFPPVLAGALAELRTCTTLHRQPDAIGPK